MLKLLIVLVFISLTQPVLSQNSFSFNCTRDTTIDCVTQCLTLKTIIPDVFSSTKSYVADQFSSRGCFRGYVNPATSGSSTNLTIDDRYSPIINIGFPFSFFGSTYNDLIASTNGFISFDVSKTLTFSHFGILKNGAALSSITGFPQDLPSNLYDRALIMGPYHDLDPNSSNNVQQIKYDVVGTAPYRKWILSYYNVPLYTTACLNLATNTHQIVLYETLGIVEIFIYDKEICLNWNKGNSMIGMQDYNKSFSILAPGRQATSNPWGKKGINESWRFIPSAGQSLFKKVELYTIAGNFLATGNTTSLGNNLLDVSFTNICPPSTGATYLVKSFYQNPSNSGADVISIDTINISRGDPIVTQILPANCAAGSKGDITIINPIGQYEYSIDGLNWQTSRLFQVTVGVYNLRARIIGSNCVSSKTVVMFEDSFTATFKLIFTPCPGPLTATIIITPKFGTPAYSYSINGGPLQSSNTFPDLPVGNYKFLIKDAAGCTFFEEISVTPTNLASAKITNTICGKPGSGTITAIPAYGTGPYTYSINDSAFQTSDIFTGLPAGTYKITIKDAIACIYSFDATVNSASIINAIVEFQLPKCNGENNGGLIIHPAFGVAPYKFSLNGGALQTDSVFVNLVAGNYNLQIKDSSACIRDTTIFLDQPNPFRITSITTDASTCLLPDGEIFIKANGGTTPYQYSIDTGRTYQPINVFNVIADLYSIKVKDINGCTTDGTAIVDALDKAMKVDLGPDKTICLGSSVTLTATTTRPAIAYIWTPSTGLSDTSAANPIASPTDTTTYFLTAKSIICVGTDVIRVNVLHKPVANAGLDTIICNNSFAILRGSASNTSGAVNYLWTPAADILNPASASTVVRPRTTRAHTYRLEVSDNYGCNFKNYDDVKVIMNEPMRAFAGNDTVASLGIPHQLFGSGGIQYLWSPSNLLNNPTAQNPLATLRADTRFNLIVKDTLGCIGTSSVFVRVYKGATYYIPNAFTPNGDGLNDVFRAIAPGIQQTNYFKIYNRLGQLLYESKNASKGWNGTYLNIPQPTGVYVWMIKGIDSAGKLVTLKGIVTLIR